MADTWITRTLPALSPWVAQWQASARLRWGVRLVLGILCVHGLLTVLDDVDQKRSALKAARQEGSRLAVMGQEGDWAARAQQAQEQLLAYRSMAWSGSDPALGEAALQDWLRKVTTGLGLTVRDLQVARVATPSAGAAATPAVPADGLVARVPPQTTAMRAKLIVDLKRSAVMALLAELQRNEQSLLVERLVWRGSAVPPQVELQLRALAGPSAPTAASAPKGQP
ncbi:hypothetical protein [Inhella crocodyli]|uniref:Uncharacterized protein n=1 Tax=Inhella crocodyli TaxID=2499851 RepID=A0A437LT44_9BURK|nr:hypothetical protein [Inhella crocodyli]RVT88586.1 hypothetical protein EOD73_06355 [Inhella crocodyli]